MFNLKGTNALINKLLFILACPFAEVSKRDIPVKDGIWWNGAYYVPTTLGLWITPKIPYPFTLSFKSEAHKYFLKDTLR